MFQRWLVTLALAGCALAAPAAAEPIMLVPGVSYDREVELTPHGPVVLHVVTAPRPGGLLTLRTALGGDLVGGAEQVTSLEQRGAAAGTSVGLAADVTTRSNRPAGLVARSGALDHAPVATRSSAGFDASGTLRVGRVRLTATWQGAGPRRPLTGVNELPGPNGAAIFTRAWGTVTPDLNGTYEAVLQPFPALVPGTAAAGTIVGFASSGNTPIPEGGAVLVARNASARRLAAEAAVGGAITLRPVLRPDWPGLLEGVGGGPELVRAGTPVFRSFEDFDVASLVARAARSAIGQRADGSLVIVSADGGRAGYSVGMTNFELAQALVRHGVVTGFALASRDAAALAFDGRLVSRPSGRMEQPVADALLLTYTGVYVPPVGVPVVSPNGDGLAEQQDLAYRLVRGAQVKAALVAPDGTVVLGDDARRDPGTYPLTWTGLLADGTPAPQGRYRWTVTAIDDAGATSTMEQAFDLNSTLGFLTPASGTVTSPRPDPRVVATFRLAQPAEIAATVESRNGAVVRALPRFNAAAGDASVSWDGLSDAGRSVFSGTYQLRVAAANALGSVELTAPLTVRQVPSSPPLPARKQPEANAKPGPARTERR